MSVPAAKKVSDTHVRMAQLMTPNDANVLGKVFGGSILSLIDLTASATASRFSGHVCVTASFDRVDFHSAIEIGEMVELEGFVSFVGRTSVEVTIDVFATRLITDERRHSNTARVTMVALADGRPTEVPRLICETRADKERFLLGRLRREIRSRRVAELAEIQARLGAASEAELDGWMASQAGWQELLR
ncbi:MAG: acyl-CoA thioesterase [Fimbriimonadaceae bacterium]|nr:acyl-CoA thioesterase [Fimbriimonadaceae bacterium]